MRLEARQHVFSSSSIFLFVFRHLHVSVPCNTCSTTGTILLDHLYVSNLFFAIQQEFGLLAHQRNLISFHIFQGLVLLCKPTFRKLVLTVRHVLSSKYAESQHIFWCEVRSKTNIKILAGFLNQLIGITFLHQIMYDYLFHYCELYTHTKTPSHDGVFV